MLSPNLQTSIASNMALPVCTHQIHTVVSFSWETIEKPSLLALDSVFKNSLRKEKLTRLHIFDLEASLGIETLHLIAL